MSTANHHTTAGQVERMNHEIITYLRFYVNWQQDNWVEILPMAQMVINNRQNRAIGMSPYEAVYGKEPRQQDWQEIENGQYIKVLHEQIKLDLGWTTKEYERYYNRKRRDSPIMKKGDRVYLKRRSFGQKRYNIRTKRQMDKLDAQQIGPFEILEVLENDNYKLKLPPGWKMHPVFHVSLLEPTKRKANWTEAFEPEEEWEVEEILKERIVNGKYEYLIKWKGYEPEESSWEPIENLNCPELMRQFQAKQQVLDVGPIDQGTPRKRDPKIGGGPTKH